MADNSKAPGGVQRGLSMARCNDSSSMFQDSCSSALTAVSSDSDPVGCWMDKSETAIMLVLFLDLQALSQTNLTQNQFFVSVALRI